MWGAGVVQLGISGGAPVPCCRPEGLLVPFKYSRCPVSAATGVGALPSRETALFTTPAWALGKKSKWQSLGSTAGWERVGLGLCPRTGSPSPAPLAAGLCAPQAGGCGWWAARARAAAAWR